MLDINDLELGYYSFWDLKTPETRDLVENKYGIKLSNYHDAWEEIITISEYDLALIKNLSFTNDDEFMGYSNDPKIHHTIGIHSKRPYGNKFLIEDIIRTLLITQEESELTSEQLTLLHNFHLKQHKVLEVCTRRLSFECGTYYREPSMFGTWIKIY